uniref:VWFA domain-containing protein n=1 Tax=Branchiostoma floridae TaxID=7739 RepID=C3YTS9_BRAFL|eukprot:XP_002600194.1 hypothetical protein BRAFLDRAFT_66699 [Branchiostoma floridae]
MRSFLFLSSAFALLSSAAFSSVLHDTTPVDCLQSQWSEWMQVSYNTQYRTRTILRYPLNGGLPCGPNEEIRQLPGSAGGTITPQETAQAFDTFFLRSQTTLTRNPNMMRDLLVILDESGSLGNVNFETTKEALATVLGYICPGIGPSYPYNQVALMTFSTSVREHFDFDDYGTYAGVRDAILQVPYAGIGTGVDNDYLSQLISYPPYQHIFHLGSFGDFNTMVDTIDAQVAAFGGYVPCVTFNPFATGRRR